MIPKNSRGSHLFQRWLPWSVGVALVVVLLWPAGSGAQNSPGGSFITNFNYVIGGQWRWRGQASPFIFEGVTENEFETTLTVVDPTADRTFTIPNATTGTFLFSSLLTNGIDAANSVWGTSNNLAFEGATADASETFFTPTDATADRTVTIQDATGIMTLQTQATVTLTNVDLDTTDNSIAAHVCEDQASVTATGVLAADQLLWVMTSTDLAVTFSSGAIVPGAGVVTIRVCNNSAGAVDPGAAADFRLTSIR